MSETPHRKKPVKTNKSLELFQQAQQVLPGGNTRTTIYYAPYPFYASRASGAKVYDVDGNEYLDFCNNMSALILGHAHPHVVEAVKKQVELGSCYASPTELEIDLARIVKAQFPCVEKIRFTNSGTEAVMNAVRLARAYTGKSKVIKFEGCYHGSTDFALIGERLSTGGSSPLTDASIPMAAPGVPEGVAEDIIVVPFNDVEALEKTVAKNSGNLAAVIMEPMINGYCITPNAGYLQEVRRITLSENIPLIFDEIVTGFRLSPGGAQELFNVKPDIAVLGKILGGGFPIGAFGGRSEFMELYNPLRGAPKLSHGGTFNANPISLVAGKTTLQEMTPDKYAQINKLAEMMRRGLNDIFVDMNFEAQVKGVQSLFKPYFTREDITRYAHVKLSRHDLEVKFDLNMLMNGVFTIPGHTQYTSTAMREEDIAFALDMAGESARELKDSM